MNLQEALEQITHHTKKYPQEAIEAIRAHAEEAKPYLRKSIEIATQKGEDLESDYDMFFYAIFLLGDFQDRESFERLMALSTLPPDTLDYLIGDVVTEGLADILYNTYNGNLELLKESIRNPEVGDFARSAMLDVMGQFYLDGSLASGEWTEFLKSLIYTDGTLGDEIYTSIVGIICKCHLKDMLPDIRYLYEKGLADGFVYGAYDDCVDLMFNYREWEERLCKSPMSIDKIKGWAMYQQEPAPKSNANYEKELKKLLRNQSSKNTIVKKQKVGRNDPCPCGSGKKYKRCCLNKPKGEALEPADVIESEEEKQRWLQEYPQIKAPEGEAKGKNNRIYLGDYYDDESIEIDKLLYLALRRRAVPIWEEKPDSQTEEKRKEAYLWQAFTKFADKMKNDRIKDVEEYNEKYAIHYKCQEWMPELLALLKKSGKKEGYDEVSKYYLGAAE